MKKAQSKQKEIINIRTEIYIMEKRKKTNEKMTRFFEKGQKT